MNRRIYRKSVAPHNQRVATDIGIPTDRVDKFIELMNFYEARKDTIKLLYIPHLTGNKVRTSGNLKFVSKGYSANNINQQLLSNDLTQTTWTSQPYLVGNIAPTETLGIENPNGGSNYLTHPTISFGANESWSVTTVFKKIGHNNTWSGIDIFGGVSPLGAKNGIYYEGTYFGISSLTNAANISHNTIKFNGKTVVFTATKNSQGSVSLFINGSSIGSVNVVGEHIFNTLFVGKLNGGISEIMVGEYFFHKIQNNAPTAQEVAQEHALLCSIYPDIESVRIGEQTWATSNCKMAATPMGNVIQEMVANGNVEKITNGGFTNDLSGWSYNPTYYTYVNGRAKFYAATEAGFNSIGQTILSIGKYYKLTFNYDVITGAMQCTQGATTISGALTGVGTYSVYFLASQTALNFGRSFTGGGAEFYIDNVSIQEIGWSGSQELYDGIYAQTAEAASSVEKFPNGNSLTDSNSDGLADGISLSQPSTNSIVTGNGFLGNAQRIVLQSTYNNVSVFKGVPGKLYKVKLKYRSSAPLAFRFNKGSGFVQYPINTGNAVTIERYELFTSGGGSDLCALFMYTTPSPVIGDWMEIGEISIKELGLSDATSIANYTYAAVKAAGFWCHYGGAGTTAIDNGAIYGKLYNWFAVKLLQMDIDYYNAANPTTPWGWRVNTATDYTTLSTYLGGYSVSGIKMKALYDSFNNSFSDNSSGLSLIPSKYRNGDGSFPANNNTSQHWAITESGNNAVRLSTTSTGIATTIDSAIAKTFGMAIRLIKT